MRPDMPKIAVERPRYNHRDRYPRGHLASLYGHDLEDHPSREAISWRRYGSKDFGENLAPLYRFLRSSVGRPWDKVWSDMCAHVSFDNVVQKHIFAHVFGIIEEHVVLRGRLPYAVTAKAWRNHNAPLHGTGRWPTLYVCPKSGLLKQARHVPRRRRAKEKEKEDDKDVVVLSAMERLHRMQGVWYRETLAKAETGALVVITKKQLNTRELARQGLKEARS